MVGPASSPQQIPRILYHLRASELQLPSHCSGRASARSASASERPGLCSGRGPSRAGFRSTATHACPERKRRVHARSIGPLKKIVIPSAAEGPAFRSFAVDLQRSTIDRAPPQPQPPYPTNLQSSASVYSVPSVVKTLYPSINNPHLINAPDLINDPVAQGFLPVRRARSENQCPNLSPIRRTAAPSRISPLPPSTTPSTISASTKAIASKS